MSTRLTVAPAGGSHVPWSDPPIPTLAAASTEPAALIQRDEQARRVVADVLAGDRDAYAVLVERDLPAVTRVCHRVLGDRDAAEEAAQEAFLSAYRSLPAWRGDGPFAAWICRIALHISLRRAHQARSVDWIDVAALDAADDVLDGGGRRVARHFRDASLDAAASMDPGRIAVAAEQATMVREALRGLEEPYRETVALRYFAGLTVPEIAEACDRPQGTVKTHLHRGLLRLRERLDAAGATR
jgi:RNA polymerase sigma-70 factor (ECF subfamily)